MSKYPLVCLFLVFVVPGVKVCKPILSMDDTQSASTPHYQVTPDPPKDLNSTTIPILVAGNTSSSSPPSVMDKPNNETSGEGNETISRNVCLQIYAPVCGTDNKTYSSACELQNAQKSDPTLSQAKVGTC